MAPDPPLPIRGEDAANAAGEGTADRAQAPSFPTLYCHSCVGRNHSGAPAPTDGAQAPFPLNPRRSVIPAKAGTYPIVRDMTATHCKFAPPKHTVISMTQRSAALSPSPYKGERSPRKRSPNMDAYEKP